MNKDTAVLYIKNAIYLAKLRKTAQERELDKTERIIHDSLVGMNATLRLAHQILRSFGVYYHQESFEIRVKSWFHGPFTEDEVLEWGLSYLINGETISFEKIRTRKLSIY